MIEELAQVVAVRGGTVEVVARRHTACGSCSAKSGCGTSLLADWFPQRPLRFEVENAIGAGMGDDVVVGLDESLLQRAVLLLYGLPLGGLLAGALVGEQLSAGLGWHSELGAVVLGLLGLTAALLANRKVSARRGKRGGMGVRLLRVAHRSTSTIPALGEQVSRPAFPVQEFRKHE